MVVRRACYVLKLGRQGEHIPVLLDLDARTRAKVYALICFRFKLC